MPKTICTADCETDPFLYGRIPEPFIWGHFDGQVYRDFTDTESFIEYCAPNDWIVYAHNGGKFDWHFILKYVDEFEPIMVINGRLARFKIGNCEFRDSYNILPFPLSAYKKTEIDYDKMERAVRRKHWQEIRAYLKDDCLDLYEIVKNFIDSYGLNLTFASASMKQWEKISGIKAPRCSEVFFDRLKPYYCGGRVQCFQSGIFNHDFKVIDINSAYPFAMMEHHPYGTAYNVTTNTPKTEAEIQRSFIRLTCRSRGAFPFRTKAGLAFPNDNIIREYYVTGWEYLAAKRTNTITSVNIREVITFNETICFKQYIEHFFKLKSEAKVAGDKAGYLFAKYFLNSLYGKYGSNPANYSEYITLDPTFIKAASDADGYTYCAPFGDLALCSKPLPEEKRRYFNPAVAASITGFVRAYMWESIKKCEGVMYCDTDSIVCTDSGKLELDKNRLGAWDVEAECNYGAIAGKKLYAFRTSNAVSKSAGTSWKTASKGTSLKPEEIIAVAKGKTIIYKNDAPVFSLKNGIKFIDKKVVATTAI